MHKSLLCAAALLAFVPLTDAPAASSLYVAGSSSVDNVSVEKRGVDGPISVSGSFSDSWGDSAAFLATAGYGYHKVAALSSSNTWLTSAGAGSEWGDALSIRSGGLAGIMRIALDITASVSNEVGPGISVSNAGFGYSLTATSSQHGFGGSFGLSVANENIRRYSFFDIPFASDDTLHLRSSASCGSAGRGTPMVASATQKCDAGGSVYWGGIVAMLDQSGNALPQWSISSDSGTDYTQSFIPAAIPEPATWATMILGFGIAGSMLRRRQRVSLRAA